MRIKFVRCKTPQVLAKCRGIWHDKEGQDVPTPRLMPLTESLFRQRQIFCAKALVY
jgi:hypothetical protein